MRRFYIRQREGKHLTVDISNSFSLQQVRQVFARLADAFYAEEEEEEFWRQLQADSQDFQETLRLLGVPSTPALRKLLETT